MWQGFRTSSTEVRRKRPRFAVAIAIGLALLLGTAGGAFALTAAFKGGVLTTIKAVTSYNTGQTSSTTMVDMPDMSLTMTVPSGTTGMFLLTFSGATSCYDATSASGICTVRAVVNGSAMQPPSVPWTVTQSNGSVPATASMQFVAGPLAAGNYTFKVQWSVQNSTAIFYGFNRTLSVIRSKV
jgi:hypothetical protein